MHLSCEMRPFEVEDLSSRRGDRNRSPVNTMRAERSIETPIGEILVAAESNAEISLACGDLPRSIANGMTIDRSIACILTVQPREVATDIQFNASLLAASVEGSPSPGECLECVEWETEEWHLTVGTEDREMLVRRFPALCIPDDPSPIECTTSGLCLALDRMPLQNAATFQFIVSYKRLPDERECSAWFFADVPHGAANHAVNPSGGSGGF